MKVHGLLLQRHAGGEERRHEGRIAVDARNTRWCSDGLEIGCDNGERVRVAFALDCCDREAMSVVASTSGITGEDVRDLMVAAVLNTLSIGAFPMRIGATWLVAALLAPGVAYAQNSTKSSCERQAKSICASAVSAHLTGASGDVLLSRGVGFGEIKARVPRWSRATVCWSRRARPRSASARPVRGRRFVCESEHGRSGPPLARAPADATSGRHRAVHGQPVARDLRRLGVWDRSRGRG